MLERILSALTIKSTCWSIHTNGTLFSPEFLMSTNRSPEKKVQFTVLTQDVIVQLKQKRKGVYWSFNDVPQSYGPFRSDEQAINDAKLYSQYGTTSKALLKR